MPRLTPRRIVTGITFLIVASLGVSLLSGDDSQGAQVYAAKRSHPRARAMDVMRDREQGHVIQKRKAPKQPEPSVVDRKLNAVVPKRDDEEKQKSQDQIPNIVHFFWLTDQEFGFHHLLSVLSAHKLLGAEEIMFHAAAKPKGRWWKEAEAVPTLSLIPWGSDAPEKVSRQMEVRARLESLMQHGGIYLGTDTIALRPFGELRRLDCVMGRTGDGLSDQVLLASQDASFLKTWYKTLLQGKFKEAIEVAAKQPDLLHVEDTRLTRPRWTDWWDLSNLYREGETVDFSDSYAIQLAYDQYNLGHTPDSVLTLDSTFGRIARTVYHGAPELKKSEKKVAEPNTNAVVPNIVHYLWFGEKDFQLHNLISMMSARQQLKAPIMFHTDAEPAGRYWAEAKLIDELTVVECEAPNATLGETVEDAILQILREEGGIYLDADVIVVKPFDNLMKYDVTMGRSPRGLSFSTVIAKKKAYFVQKLQKMRKTRSEEFDWEELALDAAVDRPDLVHVEENALSRPRLGDWKDPSLLFVENDSGWSDNFAIKLFYDLYAQYHNQYDIVNLRTTFGQIARSVYYGSPRLITDGSQPRLYPRDDYVVPNVVHYVWLTCHDFRFHHLLSVLSAHRYIKPDHIYIHSDCAPSGHNWEVAKEKIGEILEVVPAEQPEEIFGNPIHNIPHRSDITRMDVLLKQGGIYLDWDVFAFKSFDPLRRYDYVMGNEIAGLNNGVILSKPNAEFLRIWYDNYRHFDDGKWNFHSVMEPWRLASEHPNLIHMELTGLSRPDWTDWWDMKRVWNEDVLEDWSEAYAIHFIYSYHNEEHNPEDIKRMRGTFGEMARWVYYGQKEAIED
ncbi:uncharacterized protein [Branchiostoma lanceolatum]|uniref:uncharacterized protein n=1 Tax=Branchiostoma lanceolatum TaxID=7740 RepID=UPI00345691B0